MRTNTLAEFRPALRFLCGIGIVFCVLAWIEYRVAAQAQQALAAKAPFRLPFQGRLLKPDGNPVEPGNADVLFSIYDTAVGGSARWSSGLVRVEVKKGGLFTTGLEDGSPSLNTLDFTETLYVGVRVDDPNNAVILENETEMLPRILITPGVYSHQAGVLGGSSSGFLASSTQITPVGAIVPWMGDPGKLPVNWVLCQGQTIDDRESPLHGARVPDMRGRFPRGEENGIVDLTLGVGVGGTNAIDLSLLQTVSAGGHTHAGSVVAGHVLTIAEMPQHSHAKGSGQNN